MSILEELNNEEQWWRFFEHKKVGGHLSAFLEKRFLDYIENKKYLPVVDAILKGENFPLPTLTELNKKHSGKKRTVFVFPEAENMALKLLAFLFNKYDSIFPDNLYSFRRDRCVKNAIHDILRSVGFREQYSYKVDIHDYFNSVDTEGIIHLLEEYLADDPDALSFIHSILTEPYSLRGGETVRVKKGIMAGVPISGFLANLYLKELDEWFDSRGITYARYSDDIIVFARSEEEIRLYEGVIKDYLSQRKLEVNEKKEVRTAPGEPWEFLGFSIKPAGVDISRISLEKIKDKMRRKARALVRWKKRKGASAERAIRAFIRHFNAKFYDNPSQNDITWCRWYFPTITTDESLRLIDNYMLSSIRYIATGRHTKANFNLRYQEIKALGYRSLVHSFYQYKKMGDIG